MDYFTNKFAVVGFLMVLFAGATIIENEILNAVIAVTGLLIFMFGIYQTRSVGKNGSPS